ncbi:YppE family protein [Planococcus sp. FY231025]|uniref:YppE family protein n=1 Tax=Planococcus sp. FY231025 TaxID=3455699 RepID=UPI003F8D9658
MTVRKLSAELFEECGNCLDRFYEMREKDAVPDFYADVKPYADLWHAKIEQWQRESLLYIQQERPKYVHKPTIDTAAEGMAQVFVQSFYKETSKKRFVQTIQAAQYTLQTFMLAIDEKGEDK